MMAKAGGNKKAGAAESVAEASPTLVRSTRPPGRKPTGPPEQVKSDAATVRLLEDTLRRAKRPVSLSLRYQIKYLVRDALKQRRVGCDAFSEPMADIAKAAGCEVRQARVNMRTLENWGAFIRLADGGGAANATWRLDGEILFRILVDCGCNPHPKLRAGLCEPETVAGPRQSTPAVHPGSHPGSRTMPDPGSRRHLCLAKS
jgi:hypothetical protein